MLKFQSKIAGTVFRIFSKGDPERSRLQGPVRVRV